MDIQIDRIKNNIEKSLNDLKRFTSTPDKGVTRFPFTEEAKEASQYLYGYMKKVGLEVRRDASGAVIGRLEGKNKKTIMVGSHYDSVRNGGAYDGIAGIVCGIEIARVLIENGITPYYSVEIIATNDEEGARFKSGFFTSKAMLGELTVDGLKSLKDAEGISMYEAMKVYGLEPEHILEAKRDLKDIRGFIEVHVEQGPVLESSGREIGIVDTIVGMQRYIITVNGRADHAGTTPMHMRQDALEAACKMIAPIGDYARNYQDAVATVGHIKAFPNEINTVAEKVLFSIDIRCTDEQSIETIWMQAEQNIEETAKKCCVTYSIEKTMDVKPVHMDAYLKNKIMAACKERGYRYQPINSGAGHDSLPLAQKISTAMIFVPSKNGRSHCSEEFSESLHLAQAAAAVFDMIMSID